jgi:hypothetical protein
MFAPRRTDVPVEGSATHLRDTLAVDGRRYRDDPRSTRPHDQPHDEALRARAHESPARRRSANYPHRENRKQRRLAHDDRIGRGDRLEARRQVRRLAEAQSLGSRDAPLANVARDVAGNDLAKSRRLERRLARVFRPGTLRTFFTALLLRRALTGRRGVGMGSGGQPSHRPTKTVTQMVSWRAARLLLCQS